jgi:hypothetical protein
MKEIQKHRDLIICGEKDTYQIFQTSLNPLYRREGLYQKDGFYYVDAQGTRIHCSVFKVPELKTLVGTVSKKDGTFTSTSDLLLNFFESSDSVSGKTLFEILQIIKELH